MPRWSPDMTVVRVKGVKRYRAKGRWYAYHRKSGTRLQAEFGTVSPITQFDGAVSRAFEGPRGARTLPTLGVPSSCSRIL